MNNTTTTATTKKVNLKISNDLKKDLEKINEKSLATSTAKKSGFYNKLNVCKRYKLIEKDAKLENITSKNMRDARRKARIEQLNLSKSLISASKTGLKTVESLQSLYNFYFNVLNDLNTFSNISEKENPESFNIVHNAHKLLMDNVNLINLK